MPSSFPVIFRRWKAEPRSIIAILPTLPGNQDHHTCETYDSAEGFGYGHFRSMIRRTIPADPKEYAPLLRHMTRLGDRFIPIHRATREHHKTRYQATLRPAHP